MKNITKSKIITSVFIVFIFAAGILYIFMPKNDFSETEKRYLQEFPDFSIKSLCKGDFAEDFEKFLADQMPFRNFFVTVNSYFELAKGNNGSNGIYLGSDGWLIEKPFDRVNKFNINLKRICDFSQKSGVPSLIAAVPSKGCIYPEKLPKNALAFNDAEYLETLKNICGKSMTVADLSEAFKAEASRKQLFYKTDHHWTSDGAYTAYVEICRAAGLEAADEADFETETVDNFYGTSYSTSLYTLIKPDTLKIMKNKNTAGKAEVVIYDGEENRYDNMFFYDHLSEGDKYPVFLDGNHSLVTIKTGNEGGKLLLIKDSFAHCLAPFLAENYSEIIMVDLRYYRKPVSELVGQYGITQLMFVYSLENLAESTDIILK